MTVWSSPPGTRWPAFHSSKPGGSWATGKPWRRPFSFSTVSWNFITSAAFSAILHSTAPGTKRVTWRTPRPCFSSRPSCTRKTAAGWTSLRSWRRSCFRSGPRTAGSNPATEISWRFPPPASIRPSLPAPHWPRRLSPVPDWSSREASGPTFPEIPCLETSAPGPGSMPPACCLPSAPRKPCLGTRSPSLRSSIPPRSRGSAGGGAANRIANLANRITNRIAHKFLDRVCPLC